MSKWRPKILQWHLKFWKPGYGFALYWSKTIWDKHVFLHVVIATDGWNVLGRHNFLAQKLEAKIVSLVSVHSHAHRFASTSCYCDRFVQYGARRGVTRGPRGRNSPGTESLWGRQITAGGAEWLRGRRKFPTMAQVLLSIQYTCFRKTSFSNFGGPNLLLVPAAI